MSEYVCTECSAIETPGENTDASIGYWGITRENYVDDTMSVCVVYNACNYRCTPKVRIDNCDTIRVFNNRDELQAFIAKLNLAADQAWPQLTKEPI